VQIVRNQSRLDLEDGDQVLDRFDQRVAGGRVVELPDVLRDERFVAPRDADRVLEVAPQCHHRRPVGG
jgi:hypothetical protein